MFLYIVLNYTQFTCVENPVIHVACGGICQNICLQAPFGRFFRHVLNENQPPLEPNHGLVNTDLFRESVTLLEMGNERLKERAKLEEWIMTRFSPLLVVPVVIEMKEPED